MARTVTDPYSQLANVIEQVIRAEFNDEQYIEVIHDRLHESLGSDGQLHVGISPDEESTGGIEMDTTILIQFYGPFQPDVNPFQSFDPRIITTKAERLRQALSEVRTVGTPQVWFFDVTMTRYPSDATGNKTRFEMTVAATGNNTSYLVETGP